MKKSKYILLALMVFMSCKTINKPADREQIISQTLVQFDILYSGALYYTIIPIMFELSYPDTMDIRLSGKNVRIAEGNNIFNILPSQNTIYNQAAIYVINNKTGDTLQTKILHAILPPISICIGGRRPSPGLTPYYDFVNSGPIIAAIDNFGISLTWPINSFTLEMQSGDSIVSVPRDYPAHCENWKLIEHWEPWEECLTFSKQQLEVLETIQGTQMVILRDLVIPLDSNVNYVIDYAVWYVKREKE